MLPCAPQPSPNIYANLRVDTDNPHRSPVLWTLCTSHWLETAQARMEHSLSPRNACCAHSGRDGLRSHSREDHPIDVYRTSRVSRGPLAILPRHPGFSTICAHVRKPVRTDLPRRPARDTCNSEVPSSHRHTLTHLTVMALLGHLVSIYTRVAVLVTSIPAFVLAASFGEQPTCHNTV